MPITTRALSSLSLLFSSSPSTKLAPSPLFLRRFPFSLRLPFSTTATPYPLYYELVRHRPPPRSRRSRPHHRGGDGGEDSHSSAALTAHSGSADDVDAPDEDDPQPTETMDRAKRKYYRKREQRMFGGGADSDDGSRSNSADGFVELKPEIVDFPRLHAREEELYFYDAFAYPWEKEKHYRMVYQLEKKYFPQYSLDKAFVDPIAAEQVDAAAADERSGKKKKRKGKSFKAEAEKGGGDGVDGDERALVFFDDKKETDAAREGRPTARGVSEKKVEEFFKCLRKVPKVGDERKATPVAETDAGNEPYLVSRRTELPPRWDGPSGTVVLVDKPKGWTSFTVCGKLRRLVKVQKVGHAGTLDPMATGLLVVCVGKATKVVDRYQGMVKGYSGIFRLGEATSTWDADSPVIQRESWEHIKDDDIRKAAASFLGEIWQVPPMFSAIKIGGEKMYDKARRGEMVELSPRRISIYEFDIERSLEDRQNLIFRVTCSKGTYIRSLCADLGKTLGSCAHLTALRRDSIGDFSADDAWTFQELEEQIIKGYF